MIEIALGCLFLLLLLFLYTIYRTMFVKTKTETINTWKIGFFIIIISTLLFVIYFTTTIGLIGQQQTITDGITDFVVNNNSYMLSFNLMPLATAIYFLQWVFFAIDILKGISFFGRGRLDLS